MEKYFITRMEKDGSTTCKTKSGKDLGWPDFGESHVYGYYGSKKSAVASVNAEADAVYEGKYKFLIIEKMEPGIHPWCKEEDRFWMKYDAQKSKYIEVPEVKGLHVCNWAMG